MCAASSNLFGCVGLKSKEYCILNKQYTKEAWEALVPQIIEHMKKTRLPDGQAALQPQLDELRRQSQITQMQNAAKATSQGAFGGSRQALMDTETQRNLLDHSHINPQAVLHSHSLQRMRWQLIHW